MRVEAINQIGVTTSFTILPQATTIVGAPGSPVSVPAQITDTSVTWTWNIVQNANAYYLIDQSGTAGLAHVRLRHTSVAGNRAGGEHVIQPKPGCV